MNRVEGLHHLAICTSDMKAQIEYFTSVLGMELAALYWMHGVPDTWHAFLRLGDESSIAFVHNPDIARIPVEEGRTHAGNPGGNCAPGTMQHVALRVKDEGSLLAMRDRIRSHGVPVLGPLDHGMCKSIYFAGLEGLTLELSCSEEPIDARSWIDPQVQALAGISDDELRRYVASTEDVDRGGSVPQPSVDGPGPHLSNYQPPEMYRMLLEMSESDLAAMIPSDPPVKAA